MFRKLNPNLLLALGLVLLGGCASTTVTAPAGKGPAAVAEFRPGYLLGYLPPTAALNSLALLPAAPAAGSAAQALDEQMSTYTLGLHNSPRWQLAAADAVLTFPEAAATFSCAANIAITEQATPYLYQLMRRTLMDAGISVSAAKDHYQRARPFMVNNQPTCAPETEASLRHNGAYPSGHTAIGWAWGLILAEVLPQRAEPLLARGRAFGASRMVCNVHWASDVETGRFMGAATVARLHADPTFQADLAAAKQEVAAQLAAPMAPGAACEAEAQALASTPVL